MAVRSTDTFVEWRQRAMQDIAQAKLLPDAPIDLLVGMETMLIQNAREPIDQMNQSGASDVPLPPGAGQPPQAPGAPPMPPGGMAGSQMAGMGIRGGMPMPPAHAQIQSALGLIGQGQ